MSLAKNELTGTRFGHFLVRSIIAEGSIGVVLDAIQDRTGRRVALKTINPRIIKQNDASSIIKDFLNEVKPLIDCEGDGIITLYEAGVVNSVPYLALRFAGEGDVGTHIDRFGPMRPSLVRSIMIDAARGLMRMHELGYVHRDVKPANLLLMKDTCMRAIWGDLGISIIPGVSFYESHIRGTPAYIAPEIIHKGGCTPAADCYALGLTIIACLTGHQPFALYKDAEAVLAASAQESAPFPSHVSVPGSWRPLTQAMTHKDPDERPSMSDVIKHLQSIQESGIRNAVSSIFRRSIGS